MIVNFNNVEFDKAFGTSKQLPTSTLPEVAFAGRSNVGKSSLLNKLVNRKNPQQAGQPQEPCACLPKTRENRHD